MQISEKRMQIQFSVLRQAHRFHADREDFIRHLHTVFQNCLLNQLLICSQLIFYPEDFISGRIKLPEFVIIWSAVYLRFLQFIRT